MSKYDEDIERNLYLSEVGKYAVQFARNHNLPLDNIMSHPAVKAYSMAMQIEQDVGLRTYYGRS